MLLRQLHAEHSVQIARLGVDPEIACNTVLPDAISLAGGIATNEGAALWIKQVNENFVAGTGIGFAIELNKCAEAEWATIDRQRPDQCSGLLVGVIGLEFTKLNLADLDQQVAAGEIGYWIGQPFRNQGFCTEAALAVLGLAFTKLDLSVVTASHFADNGPSAAVMRRLGMCPTDGSGGASSMAETAFASPDRPVAHWQMSRSDWDRSVCSSEH